LSAIRAEGVGVAGIARGGARMGIYFVESGADLRPMRVVYDRAGSAFSAMTGEEFDWATLLRGASWLHLSGITPALGGGPARAAADAARVARSLGVLVSLDLNYRPALWAGRDPRPFVEPLAAASDLLIGNPGAFAAMLGITTPEGGGDALVESSARTVHAALGCARVAITRRDVKSASAHGWNACLFDGATGSFFVSRRYDVQVVDRVGGGDSFAAGLLHALIGGQEPAQALEFATAASALKLTVPGDFNRVSADEVSRVLESGP
jgi:2-dehydro-3-deoxygluconokinase